MNIQSSSRPLMLMESQVMSPEASRSQPDKKYVIYSLFTAEIFPSAAELKALAQLKKVHELDRMSRE